jgi:3-hydroxyisobutyrate dehydrogenase-like beta-hydroxyacid dehydrogenase
MRIGFVGLGDQGTPMAERLLAAGHRLTVVARKPSVQIEFAARGATVVPTLKALGTASDLVCVVVRDDGEVREVVDAVREGMRPSGLVAVHSTVHPDTCCELAADLGRAALNLIDAPVSGGPRVAREGRLTVMIGGDIDVVERVAPVFGAFAGTVRRLGPVGAGQLTKLINNLYAMAHEATTFEEIGLAAAAGLDLAAAVEVLGASSGTSWQFAKFAALDFAPRPYPKGHGARTDLMEANLDLLCSLDIARDVDVSATVALVRAYLARRRALL